jgi:crotonobetainyl-CoA:carnitine CoA-transferase CaiB-like acyl-CoA transferase
VAGREDLQRDPRFATGADRLANAPQLASALATIFAARAAADWEQLLVPEGVACVHVNQGPFSEFTISDPTMVENGFTTEVEHPLFGRHHRHGPIVTLSDTPGSPGPGPLVGQHTRQILGELGYSNEEVDELRRRDIVSWP